MWQAALLMGKRPAAAIILFMEVRVNSKLYVNNLFREFNSTHGQAGLSTCVHECHMRATE